VSKKINKHLRAENAQLKQMVATLEAELEHLDDRILELRDQAEAADVERESAEEHCSREKSQLQRQVDDERRQREDLEHDEWKRKREARR
jgi:predicted nuclease with TOPRIM domain